MKFVVNTSFIIAIVGSMMSQLPYFVVTGSGGFLKMLWVIPFVLMLIPQPKEYLDRSLRPFYYFVILFFAYCFVLQAFTTKNYISADITNMLMDLAILAVSFKYWKKYGNRKTLFLIAIALLISSLFLSYRTYYDYYVSYDIMNKQYAYASKNSLSMVILCGLAIPILSYVPRNVVFKIVYWIPSVFIIFMLFVMKSRACLAGLLFLYLYFVFSSRSKILQFATILFGILISWYIITHPLAYDIIVDGIILGARDVNNLDELSSGRVHDIEEGLPLFLNNIYCGIGRYYLDNMPVAMLIQYGIVGATLVFSYLYYVGALLLSKRKKNQISLTAFLLYFVFIINSLFEAQAPFGPGVKCFPLWMILGFALANNFKLKENN